jgi:hypothetical protein
MRHNRVAIKSTGFNIISFLRLMTLPRSLSMMLDEVTSSQAWSLAADEKMPPRPVHMLSYIIIQYKSQITIFSSLSRPQIRPYMPKQYE